MIKDPESRILNIVLVGNFNPSIFSPAWLSAKGIISEDEVSAAKTDVVHPEVARFTVSDCTYEVFLDRFVAKSKHAHMFERLLDQVIDIFSILKETPIRQMGLNWHTVYKFLESEKETYVNFGHHHLPKEGFWNKHLKNPGLHDLRVQSQREDSYNGHLNAYIKKIGKPADQVVELQINDHYEFGKNDEDAIYSADAALEVLTNNYDQSRERANRLLQSMFEYGVQ